MEHTQGKWEVISRKDDDFEKPYYDYHIISYPYGIEAGPERICEPCSKFNAEYIVKCCNLHDGLVDALREAKTLLLQITSGDFTKHEEKKYKIIKQALAAAEEVKE